MLHGAVARFGFVVVPEYIDGEDEGFVRRTLATASIVPGSMLFAVAVIAILVQWLDETTGRLELGLTPVALDAHFILPGWSSRTPAIPREIMASRGPDRAPLEVHIRNQLDAGQLADTG